MALEDLLDVNNLIDMDNDFEFTGVATTKP